MKAFLISIRRRYQHFPRQTGVLLLEILFLVVWTLFIGMEYLDFNQNLWPGGVELITNSQSNAMWIAFQRCGICFLWNGSTNGGAPSFVELLGAPLHPVVMVSTLLFGFINGIKATLLCSLLIAGLAQLWLGRILRLHPLVRIWCAGIAIAGGHLSGRMQTGLVSIVLSTACCSLIIPALLQFLLSSSRKNVVVLSLVLGSAILSGQGYLQIGFAVSILPAFLMMGIFFYRPKPFPLKRLIISAGLAMLLTAFFLIPLIHFLPLLHKESDPAFITAQPLQYLPLNLVISDLNYFYYPDLGKYETFTFAYANYIGWLPILLTLSAFALKGKKVRGILLLFLVSTVMVFLAASGWTFRLAAWILPTIGGSIRYPTMIAGLAVPLILAMAGLGAQAILIHPWPSFVLRLREESHWHLRIPVRGLVTALLSFGMVLSLAAVAGFSFTFLTAEPAQKYPEEIFQLVSTPELDWVQPPYLEFGWFPEMLNRNLIIPAFPRAWKMKERVPIDARFTILPNLPEPVVPDGWSLIRTVGNYRIYINEAAHFAILRTSVEEIPCTATGMWGELDATCTSDAAGLLELKEYFYGGWQATIDGVPASIPRGQFLSVPMPPGTHTASFRYRPWDVPLGGLLTIIGGIFAGIYLRRGRRDHETDSIEGDTIPLEPGDFTF
jgi:hypothetical protein